MTRTALALLLALAFPPLATAGELAQDRRELGRGQTELRDDVRDVEQVEALSRDWQAARAGKRGRVLIAVELRVWDSLLAELDEAQREVRKAARELRRSQREVARDADRTRPARFADDARDRRDDRRDLELERRYHERLQKIEREWDGLVALRTNRALDRKHALLTELVRLARDEAKRTAAELREDRVERREDRRERDHR